ncbi:hypothetical protein EVAR_68283_1 [Eumeta japonica]|uniref:Uncharacterized protein n=1 Tax=Eumeta variegata TaxID=151549 RepID=A0A4C1ZX87_EUMVA|nr:hypothetical protein EVAR_68283_1 [Eumeta japonica]
MRKRVETRTEVKSSLEARIRIKTMTGIRDRKRYQSISALRWKLIMDKRHLTTVKQAMLGCYRLKPPQCASDRLPAGNVSTFSHPSPAPAVMANLKEELFTVSDRHGEYRSGARGHAPATSDL